jgi:hypothetical protein
MLATIHNHPGTGTVPIVLHSISTKGRKMTIAAHWQYQRNTFLSMLLLVKRFQIEWVSPERMTRRKAVREVMGAGHLSY